MLALADGKPIRYNMAIAHAQRCTDRQGAINTVELFIAHGVAFKVIRKECSACSEIIAEGIVQCTQCGKKIDGDDLKNVNMLHVKSPPPGSLDKPSGPSPEKSDLLHIDHEKLTVPQILRRLTIAQIIYILGIIGATFMFGHKIGAFDKSIVETKVKIQEEIIADQLKTLHEQETAKRFLAYLTNPAQSLQAKSFKDELIDLYKSRSPMIHWEGQVCYLRLSSQDCWKISDELMREIKMSMPPPVNP